MAVRIQEPGVARPHPSVGRQRRCRAVGVAQVAAEGAGAAELQFPRGVDAQLHVLGGAADGVGADLAVGLQGEVDRGFGLAVELLQVQAQRPVEAEHVGADGLAGGVADLEAVQAHLSLQRPVHQHVA